MKLKLKATEINLKVFKKNLFVEGQEATMSETKTI